ncbi:MAG: NAD(P)-dependent oxidoreductase [Cellvibrionales bacterium]|nr:NAD(P)-dependent oxidoreductase [Cellvibrionales bacterium]
MALIISGFVCAMMPTPLPSWKVTPGFLPAKRGAVIAIHSTVKLDTISKLAAKAAQQGVTVIDAPITGGAHGAAAKKLCYMVGGGSLDHCRR